jgi:hypothetical protein|tara:strand:- start:800 stop:1288 length:489 start_codon:yes stop_codon:yes gene_type:complete
MGGGREKEEEGEGASVVRSFGALSDDERGRIGKRNRTARGGDAAHRFDRMCILDCDCSFASDIHCRDIAAALPTTLASFRHRAVGLKFGSLDGASCAMVDDIGLAPPASPFLNMFPAFFVVLTRLSDATLRRRCISCISARSGVEASAASSPAAPIARAGVV